MKVKMTLRKRLMFGVITALVVAFIAEGASRVILWRMERTVFNEQEEALRNQQIHYTRVADPQLIYRLRPGVSKGTTYINKDGFAQRDVVPVKRTPGKLRIVAMGESTTQGHDVDKANYPFFLRKLVEKHTGREGQVELLNAGVSGWISDQIVIYAENEIAEYRPDILVLYVGWNDFQGYDPLGKLETQSYYDKVYGTSRKINISAGFHLKSVAMLSALYQKYSNKYFNSVNTYDQELETSDVKYYRFYFKNLDSIIAAFREKNPDVKVCISTLVCRWPFGTKEDFESVNGHTWWMDVHDTKPDQAAELHRNMNNHIRAYAKKNNLFLIDAEKAFASVDKGKLQTDFCHMHGDGYELLAEAMFDALRQHQVIEATESPRRSELLTKYKLDDPAARVAEKKK